MIDYCHSTVHTHNFLEGDPVTSTLSLRDRQRITRRNAILDAAKKLFDKEGYEGVTTKNIAEVAEIGEATLFRYFASKSEIFFSVIGKRVEESITDAIARDDETVREATQRDVDYYLERIAAVYRARAELFEQDPRNILTFALLGLEPDPDLHYLPIQQGDRVVDLVAVIIDEGQKQGVLNPDVNGRDIAINLNGTYIHEMSRAAVRDLPAEGFTDRLLRRHDVQLAVLRYI